MSKIEWTDTPWNVVHGCTPVSPGCSNCYAARMAKRLGGRFGYPEAPHQFQVTMRDDRLEIPHAWRKPRKVFVASMGDLFHQQVKGLFIVQVLALIQELPQHTFQILTKRSKRMAYTFQRFPKYASLPNLWLGVSVEDPFYLSRINDLITIPAPVRFVSLEPLLAPIDLDQPVLHDPNDRLIDHLQWVIVGGESGPGARPMHPAWARDISDQCQAAGVPFFFKQWGAWAPAPSQPAGTPGNYSLTYQDRSFVPIDHYPRSYTAYAAALLQNVGKKRAGRLLDGRERNEMPTVQPIPPQEVTNG